MAGWDIFEVLLKLVAVCGVRDSQSIRTPNQPSRCLRVRTLRQFAPPFNSVRPFCLFRELYTSMCNFRNYNSCFY
jgi:hypothetical protein